ncbi:MAG: hypothetical protein AB1641_22410 [Thermodesulfobacteriota bacterium]
MAPDRLEHVPERLRIIETLGGQFGLWGAMFLVVAGLFLLSGKGPSNDVEWLFTGASGAIGLILAGYEVWRRQNRTVLFKDGDRIAVYRRGRLDMTLTIDQITRKKPGLDLALKVGVCLAVAAAIFTAIGLTGLLRDEEALVDNLIILTLGLTCWTSLAAAAWIWLFYDHWRVPIKSWWLAEETVLVKHWGRK